MDKFGKYVRQYRMVIGILVSLLVNLLVSKEIVDARSATILKVGIEAGLNAAANGVDAPTEFEVVPVAPAVPE